jgi:RimJ/RimL family protein N-acetyltransferase
MRIIAETERLIIRTFSPEDWPQAHVYLSDPEVMRYLPDPPYDAARTRRLIHELSLQTERGPDLPNEVAVALKKSGTIIGQLGFFSRYGLEGTYEIGWVFHRGYSGRGYATEAARAMIDYGFRKLGLHRVVASCDPENVASWRVMEKLGMRREAHALQAVRDKGGGWHDEYTYAILASEWIDRDDPRKERP